MPGREEYSKATHPIWRAQEPSSDLGLLYSSEFFLADVPAGRFMKDDGTRPIKDGTLMDVEEDMEQVTEHFPATSSAGFALRLRVCAGTKHWSFGARERVRARHTHTETVMSAVFVSSAAFKSHWNVRLPCDSPPCCVHTMSWQLSLIGVKLAAFSCCATAFTT